MSCNYYVNDNPAWVGTMYISGTTCSGSPAAYNLSYGDSVCMDNEEPMTSCDALTVSGSCLPVTPTPSPAVGYLCFSTGKTYTTTDYICPNDGNTYQDIYGKINVQVFEDYLPDYSHPPLSFTVSNGSETRVITIPSNQSFIEFVFCRQEFNYTSSGCSVTVLPDWNIVSFFEGYYDCSCFTSGLGFNNTTNFIIPDIDNFIIGGTFTTYNDTNVKKIISLNNNGSIDTSKNFGLGFSGASGTFDFPSSGIKDSDGKYVIVGSFTSYNGVARNRIVRLNNDGSIDYTFNVGTGFSRSTGGSTYAIIQDNNGKYVVVGDFDNYNGTSVNSIVRLNNDGSIDNTFNSGTGFTRPPFINTIVTDIIQDSSGKYLATGTFTLYNGTTANRIVRINYNGSIDNTFNSGTGFNTTTRVVREDSSGKYLVGGLHSTYNGTTTRAITRLNNNGSIDNTFSNGTNLDPGSQVFSIVVLNDGKILVGGDVAETGSVIWEIARLNTNGTIDYTFYWNIFNAGNPSAYVSTVLLLNNNKILIGGSFTTVESQLSSNIALLTYNGDLDICTLPDPNPICVSGAGTSAVNGTYVFNGYINSKPRYRSGTYNIEWVGSFWQIKSSSSVTNVYRSPDDVYYPYQATTWLTGTGLLPLPVVNEGGCVTPTPTPSQTATPGATPSQTQTNTPSITPTNTNTPTITATPTITPSPTTTMGITPTQTQTNTPTITSTPSITPTNTETPTQTQTSTQTPTNTQTQTSTQTPTNTSSQTPTNTSTPTNTPTPSTTPPVRYILSIFARLDPTDPPANDVELYYSFDNVNYTASGVFVNSTTCGFVANLSVIEGQTAYIRWIDQIVPSIVYEVGRDTISTCPALSTICTDFVLMNVPKTRSYTIGSIICANPDASPTPTATITDTPTQTPTNSVTPTNTPTNTQTPTGTPPVTPTNTQTQTNTPTNTQTNTTTPTPTNTPPIQYIVTINARLDPTNPPVIDVELYYSLDNVTFIPSGQLATTTTCDPIVFLQVNAGSIVYTKWVDPSNPTIIYQHGRAVGSTCPALSTICVDFFTVNANGSRSYTIGDQTC